MLVIIIAKMSIMPNKKTLNFIKFILIFFLLLAVSMPSIYADVKPPAAETASVQTTDGDAVKDSDSSSVLSSLYAKYAVLLDADTGRVLLGKNETQAAPNASTTKIMTCIIALEYGDAKLCCTTSKYAASMPDVQLNAASGEVFVLHDLLYSLMLKSHNDTAVIIAENVACNYIFHVRLGQLEDTGALLSGKDFTFIPEGGFDSSFLSNITTEQSKLLVSVFTGLMNEKATQLGCTDTHFITPNGLDAEDENGVHSTTARDLATIMSYCIQNPEFLSITETPSYSFTSQKRDSSGALSGSGKSYAVSNANAFLNMYENIISGKTGFTGDAGYCYICAYKDSDRTFVVALLACGWPNNKTYKWHDAKQLLNWARQHCMPSDILGDDFRLKDIRIGNGLSDHSGVCIHETLSMLLADTEQVNVVINVPEYMEAPVTSGQQVGDVSVYINDLLYKTVPAYATDNVIRKDFLYYLKQTANRLLFVDK